MTTRYAVRFEPSFHPEAEIEVMFGPEGEFVRVRTQGHGERAPLSIERGVRFLEEMEALDPTSIPNGDQLAIDGCVFVCSVQQRYRWKHVFTAVSPEPGRFPRQHSFVSLVHQVAWEAVRQPATVAVLEQLFGYFDDGLTARLIQGEPLCVRIFGSLSSTYEAQLEELFASVPRGAPVLMDLTNFDGMGTLLYPCFRRFHSRPGRTAWLANELAMRYLRGAGIPTESIFSEQGAAGAAL